MGSESDRPSMQKCVDALDQLGLDHDWQTISAHRDPDRLRDYIRDAVAGGTRVFIAGAGMAAHLPGVVASHTTLPVIGVPLSGGSLHGVDSLLAIVQMPPGIPVATVAVGDAGARNAAFLAASILSVSEPDVAAALDRARAEMRRR